MAGDPALRGLAVAIDARQPRDEQPAQRIAPRGMIGWNAGIGERSFGFRLDRGCDAAGALQLSETDRAGALVLSHQPLQHEGEQR